VNQLSKIIILLIGLYLVAACNGQNDSGDDYIEEKLRTQTEKVWVYIQINVPYEENQIDSFWYYGQIPLGMYNKMANNSIEEGFFQLRNVHYYSSDEDAVFPYEDDEDTGNIIFKVEHVARKRIKARSRSWSKKA